MIKKQIAENAEIMIEDFDYAPFNQQGGVFRAKQLFGDKLSCYKIIKWPFDRLE